MKNYNYEILFKKLPLKSLKTTQNWKQKKKGGTFYLPSIHPLKGDHHRQKT